jgi:glycosyltransferase involved in cell wall biosynthesis
VLQKLGLKPGGYVLAVGRLEETKRFEDLIRGHRIASPDVQPLVIVGSEIGESPYARTLRANADEGVIFAGYRSGAELAALYRNASKFIHASAMEGFGLVSLEALAAGVPVHLSDIPPHREFALPEEAYFQVGDIEAIATALASRPYPPLSAAAREALEQRYDPEQAIAAHLRVYRDLC